MTYYRSLDGLRAAAVSIVLLAHAGVPFVRSGGAGVDVFFTLSGFLITGILLAELDRTGAVNVRHFYARRFLRLLPCLWMTLAAVVLAAAVSGQLTAVLADAIYAATYSMNWVRATGQTGGGPLSHTWTLAIEEQYYLLWPLVVAFACRNRAHRGLHGMVLLAAAAAVAAYRNGAISAFSRDRIHYGLDTHADPLLIGSALACFLSAARKQPLPESISRILGAVLAPLALAGIGFIVLSWAWGEGPPALTIGYPLAAIATAVLLVDAVAGRHSLLKPVLEIGAVVWVGRISYGIYLWHLPIFTALRNMGQDSWPRLLVIGGGLTLAVSGLSYYLVERRFLNLKRLFAPPVEGKAQEGVGLEGGVWRVEKGQQGKRPLHIEPSTSSLANSTVPSASVRP